jgi:hypothetical protein
MWVTPEIKKRIEDRAKEKGMNLSEYVRTVIDRDLEKNGGK